MMILEQPMRVGCSIFVCVWGIGLWRRGTCRTGGRGGVGGRMPGVWTMMCAGTEAIRQEILMISRLRAS